jgi:hypothetical protein
VQALDIFMSPIPDFDDDIPILTVPVSVRPPGDEPASEPSAGASDSASKTQAGKQKATANPTPQKKDQESRGEIFKWDQN